MNKTNAKNNSNNPSKWVRYTIIGLIVTVAVAIVFAVVVRQIYNNNLKPLNDSQELVVVDIPKGYSVQQIGDKLQESSVIKKSWAFNWYVRTNGFIEDMKAGTYAFRPSQGVPEIVDIIAGGEVATDSVTILPGQRIDQIEATLINSGFDPAEVEKALDPASYKNHPALVDKPAGASLEGYIYPETFLKTGDTSPKQIISQSLDEMQKRLTPSLRAAISKQGLSVYEGIILASVVEQEVSNIPDKATVASVFFNRLNNGTRLESDVTVLYGAVNDGKAPDLTYDSAYNTFTRDGLPIGPISNVTKESLTAVARPRSTDYLFFVAGDDGKTYFSKTLQQHEAAVEKYCKKLCN